MQVADFVLRIVQWLVVPALVLLVRQILGLRRDLEELRHKQVYLQECFENLPGEKALHDLALAIERQNGEIKAMVQVVTRLEKTVCRQEDFLLGERK
ncbi:MAG: hypothetical protein KQJ78_11070 [Deltaproteobacteria bacterium]|nr:hypothetical protein [Deltaproteobacteria bacterium]